jgi:TalC/MipB family fructose-6-phosphate aldolase
MQIWLDSIDIATIKHAAGLGILAGVTTNPSILSRSTQHFDQVVGDILDGQPGWLAVQVVEKEYDSIVKQARKLAAISDRIIVKIPAVDDGFRAIATLERENITTLATTIFESRQIVAAALCGASYAAPYVNRIETATGRAFEMLEESQKIIDKYGFKTKILAASFKSVDQFIRCATLGLAAVTLPDNIYRALFASNEHIANSLNQFDSAWVSNAGMNTSRFFALD